MFLNNTPGRILKKYIRLILAAGLALAVLSLVVSLFYPLQYRADAQILIISKSRYGVDPYTVVKSAEQVGENITQVMKTNDFFQKVMNQPGYSIDPNKFADMSEREKRKLWQKTVIGSVVYGTGVLNISAYDVNQEQAIQLAGASADTLVSKGWEYVGSDLAFKVVNDPIATRWPVRPNLFLNVICGFVVGVVVTSLFVLNKYYKKVV